MQRTSDMRHRMAGEHALDVNLGRWFAKPIFRTKGGAGGPTTTVSTLPQLSSAAAASGPLVIVVQGAISGAAKVNVSSDKTIVGKSGSCKSTRVLKFTSQH